MKKITVLMTVLLMGIAAMVHAQGDSTATFKVYGNCESCKARIEKAAKAAGATKADWSEETKMIEVSFNSTKTSSDKIQQKLPPLGTIPKSINRWRTPIINYPDAVSIRERKSCSGVLGELIS